jgi:uncharacterized protein HemX
VLRVTTTGEQPKAETALGENSTVRVSLMITFIVVAFGAGAAHWRVSAQEAQNAEHAQLLREQAKELAALTTRVTLGESTTADLIKKLDRMDLKLDRLLEKGTNSANYRPPRGPVP